MKMFVCCIVIIALVRITNSEEKCPPSPYSGANLEGAVPETVIRNASVLPPDYSHELPPAQPDGCPAVVYVEFLPKALGDIAVDVQSYEVDLYMQFRWNESRLLLSEEIPEFTLMSEEMAKKVWTPMFIFRNCVNCVELKFEETNKMFVKRHDKISNNVELSFLDRTSWKYRCDFDLSAYPLDTQECVIELQSLDVISVMLLKDMTIEHKLMSDMKPPEYAVLSMSSGDCRFLDQFAKMYDCVEYAFILRRLRTHHAMLTYAPSMLIVILSWLSFWLDVEAAAPRVTLGLTTLLTLATQFSNAQKNLPAVAYMKAIDVWMFTCMFMVVASLIQFAIACRVARVKPRNPEKRNPAPNVVRPYKAAPRYREKTYYSSYIGKDAIQDTPISTPAAQENIVDRIARVLFPLIFGVFNIVYWGYYASK